MYEALAGATYFSMLDIAFRYWQVEMDLKEQSTIAFAIRERLFLFHSDFVML